MIDRFPYGFWQRDYALPQQRIKPRYIVSPIDIMAGFCDIPDRSLDAEILRIARNYQFLNQLYHPDHGTHIHYARDIEYPNQA